MTIRRTLVAGALLGALALPSLASAQATAYAVAGTTNMRAGPDTQYPAIAKILAGSAVHVFGCISGRVWCDAQVQGTRGWVNSNRLEFVHGGRRVLVPQYYASFGVPTVGFDVGYWDLHYRTRPWYRERSRWWRDDDRKRDGRRDNGPRCDGINVACIMQDR